MIAVDEKYLKSIDNTLKDILKELKRQARLAETHEVKFHHEVKVEGNNPSTGERIAERIEGMRKLAQLKGKSY